MNYAYNYSFLREWMKCNPHINRKKILKGLGTKSYTSIRDWSDGLIPMPIMSILRFCNYFNVPLEYFFRDKDSNEIVDNLNITAPYPFESLTPLEGSASEKKKGRCEGGVNPEVYEHVPCNLPEKKKGERGKTYEPVDTEDEEGTMADEPTPYDVNVEHYIALADKYKKWEEEMYKRHAEERMKLIEVIKIQACHIAKLENMLSPDEKEE